MVMKGLLCLYLYLQLRRNLWSPGYLLRELLMSAPSSQEVIALLITEYGSQKKYFSQQFTTWVLARVMWCVKLPIVLWAMWWWLQVCEVSAPNPVSVWMWMMWKILPDLTQSWRQFLNVGLNVVFCRTQVGFPPSNPGWYLIICMPALFVYLWLRWQPSWVWPRLSNLACRSLDPPLEQQCFTLCAQLGPLCASLCSNRHTEPLQQG